MVGIVPKFRLWLVLQVCHLAAPNWEGPMEGTRVFLEGPLPPNPKWVGGPAASLWNQPKGDPQKKTEKPLGALGWDKTKHDACAAGWRVSCFGSTRLSTNETGPRRPKACPDIT